MIQSLLVETKLRNMDIFSRKFNLPTTILNSCTVSNGRYTPLILINGLPNCPCSLITSLKNIFDNNLTCSLVVVTLLLKASIKSICKFNNDNTSFSMTFLFFTESNNVLAIA